MHACPGTWLWHSRTSFARRWSYDDQVELVPHINNAGPGKNSVKSYASANMCLVPIQSTAIQFHCFSHPQVPQTYVLGTVTRNSAHGIKLALLLSPHHVGFFASMAKLVHIFFSYISSFAAAIIPYHLSFIIVPGYDLLSLGRPEHAARMF